MDPEWNADNIGQTLGLESVGSVVSKVEEYCAYEEKRIVLKNQPAILSLRAEIGILQDEERNLEERLSQAQPPSDLRSRRRQLAYYWTVAIVLVVAAFVFSIVAFEPYRLGWKSYLYCLGIAIVTPYLVEEVIERWIRTGLVKTLATAAVTAALLSLILLAVIRGDLLVRQVDSSNAVVLSDEMDAAPAASQPGDFYRNTFTLLRLAMALLAFAMEIGSGLALHKARGLTTASGEDWKVLRRDLREVRDQMVVRATALTALENEPALFVARFWRNFYQAMLTHTVRNAMTKLTLGLVLAILSVCHGRAVAEERVTIIAAIDLTQSVAVAGHGEQTDFQKNVQGITRLLAQAPVSSRIIVLGITDKSFTQPRILLSARVADDPGYFGERLDAARRQLVGMWKRRSTNIEPQFKYTDILGVLLVAGQMFDASPKSSRKMLVIFSDMRHHTDDLDLESRRSVPPFRATAEHSRIIMIAPLQSIEVWVLGVDGTEKSIPYWQSLKTFWIAYFRKAGAFVCNYSILRDAPVLTNGNQEGEANGNQHCVPAQ
jgi:hypothetical protein